jgi:hypothetical protein
MKKIISPCLCKVYTRSGNKATARAFYKIQFENGRLSITGVIGPMPSGDCRGGAGQCVDAIREGCPCDEWTQEMLDKFCSIWDEWHLNDMRPYCKPYPVCGYQYGHAWQTEEVPQEVIDWLFNLPESPVVPAWV